MVGYPGRGSWRAIQVGLGGLRPAVHQAGPLMHSSPEYSFRLWLSRCPALLIRRDQVRDAGLRQRRWSPRRFQGAHCPIAEAVMERQVTWPRCQSLAQILWRQIPHPPADQACRQCKTEEARRGAQMAPLVNGQQDLRRQVVWKVFGKVNEDRSSGCRGQATDLTRNRP